MNWPVIPPVNSIHYSVLNCKQSSDYGHQGGNGGPQKQDVLLFSSCGITCKHVSPVQAGTMPIGCFTELCIVCSYLFQ